MSLEVVGDAVICLINRERRVAGLRRLDVSHRLSVAAWKHSRDMRDDDFFSHDSLDGRSFGDRIREAGYLAGHEQEAWVLGETLAWAAEGSSDAASLVGALMDSPPHRRVILDGRHRELGAGLVRGTPEAGGDGGVTLTIDYGSLRSPDALREDPPAGRRARREDARRAEGSKARASAAPALVTSSTSLENVPAATEEDHPGKGHTPKDKSKGHGKDA